MSSPSSNIQCNTQGIDMHTSTPDEFAICDRCQSNNSNNHLEAKTASSSYLNDYIDALQYINSCHVLINQVIQCRNPGQKVSMPQMPNFLNVLTYIAQDVHELSELKSFDSLEKIFQEMNLSDAAEHRKVEPCVMSDKEVEAFHPPCIHAKTSMNRIPYSSTRGTGIPRRIKGGNLKTNTSGKRQTSPSTWSSSDLSRLGRNKTTSSIILKKKPIVPPIAIYPTRDDSPDKLHPHELPIKQQVEGTSDQDTVSNEDMNHYAKQILLGPKDTQNTTMEAPKGKVRKALSKTQRDYVMIKKFLKQWGIETDLLETEDVNSIILHERNELRKDMGDCSSNTTSQQSQRSSSIKPDEESDANAVPFLPHIQGTPKSSKASTERRRSLTFNDIAASSAGLENTFITNEQPAWPTSPSVLYKSDESDIEPDSDDLVKSKLAKCRAQTFQKKSGPAPCRATSKPKDCFLASRRRKSHSDIDSEQLLAESDVDDDLFDRKKRLRSNITFRPPVLPQKILSNIGILTQTGKVKPEKERHLQELRSRLASDMQTPLFRKPRNRKLETNDIVQLKSEFQLSEKSRTGRY